ncbi:hypothetical protein BDV93DRAFT_455889, partial [Ceratobasidium sp. AG-I]
THLLFRSPHLRFSREQQTAVLQWAESCGMADVPTLYGLDKCDQYLKECGGDATREFKTSKGDVFFMNTVESAVRQDISNPHTREHMQFYPTDGEGEINEIWDGEKLSHGLSPNQLTPMVALSNGDFFVNELCELVDNSLFVPEMFLRRQGELWARGFNVICSEKVSTLRLVWVSGVKLICGKGWAGVSDGWPGFYFSTSFRIQTELC